MSRPPPEILIVGGGILGCALAWKLAARGVCRGNAIWVVEAQSLASQATSRAAGLLSLARPAAKAHWIPLVEQTFAASSNLSKLGHHVPVHHCGAVHVAASANAATAADALESAASIAGIHAERRTPDEFADRLPFLDMTRFKDALWFPNESYTDPYLLASAYSAAARAHGVRFLVGTAALLRQSGQRNRVRVEIGGQTVDPASVWVAAGAWSGKVLSPLNIEVAQAAVRSHYWITERLPQQVEAMPMVLAPDFRFYARPDVGALLFGLRETDGVAVSDAHLPADLAGFTFDEANANGYETLASFSDQLAHYAPGLMATPLRHYISGPSCYTPDGEFLLGAVDGWENLNLLSGCNGAGIAASAGLADLAADFVEYARPIDKRFNPNRFGHFSADSDEWRNRCIAARAGKSTG